MALFKVFLLTQNALWPSDIKIHTGHKFRLYSILCCLIFTYTYDYRHYKQVYMACINTIISRIHRFPEGKFSFTGLNRTPYYRDKILGNCIVFHAVPKFSAKYDVNMYQRHPVYHQCDANYYQNYVSICHHCDHSINVCYSLS